MNFLQTLIEFLQTFWPFEIIQEYERGVLYIFGRAQEGLLTPGLYVVFPWFTSIETVNIVPNPISTPLLNITLSDDKTLGYSMTAIVHVDDPWKALNNVDDYEESVGELITSKASDKLQEVDAGRLDYGSRRRLLTDLTRWVNEDTQPFGVEVDALRFTNFAINQRAYRLLIDRAIDSQAM